MKPRRWTWLFVLGFAGVGALAALLMCERWPTCLAGYGILAALLVASRSERVSDWYDHD